MQKERERERERESGEGKKRVCMNYKQIIANVTKDQFIFRTCSFKEKIRL